MTIDVLKKFGIKIKREGFEYFKIYGNQKYFFEDNKIDFKADWSVIANFLVLGAILGDLTIENVNLKSLHPDKKILEVLTKAGVYFDIKKKSIFVKKAQNINPFIFDATNSPDLVPPIVVLASFALGKSEIFGIERLKYKESNRAFVLKEELKKTGIKINLFENKMEIFGTKEFKYSEFDSHNDHRIAMALSVFSVASQKKWFLMVKTVFLNLFLYFLKF